MADPEPRRGRTHDAEGAQEAILNAAEQVFAEHGFDGARIDAIAAAANYNKSLIFHYFGDKLGLYTAVLRRADNQTSELQGPLLAALQDPELASHARSFRALLATLIGIYFDYLLQHPNVMRILNWELAEGWQTLAKIMSQRDREDFAQFRVLLQRVEQAGLLRADLDPTLQIIMAFYFCQSYLGTIPLCQMLLPDEDLSSAPFLASARQHFIDFVLHGLLVDPPTDEA